MSPELIAALASVRGYVMTPEETFEQRVSFVYGGQDHSSGLALSKDKIREMLTESHGRPACPHCASLTTELAASRAREAKLREALEKIELHTWGYPDRWEPMRVEMRHIARAALSASEDATD